MYGFNPYTMPQAPVGVVNSNRGELIRVTGFDGAKAYQMPPNSSVALFDSNEDIFYVKTTDGAGFPTIRDPAEKPTDKKHARHYDKGERSERGLLSEVQRNGI